jgi:hypothetical protein
MYKTYPFTYIEILNHWKIFVLSPHKYFWVYTDLCEYLSNLVVGRTHYATYDLALPRL